MKQLERYVSKFKEYNYTDKEYEVLGISLDNSKNIYILGFKKERNAETAKDYFENYSDITIFAVDYYGYSTIEDAENYFSKQYNVVGYSVTSTDIAIKKNPDAVVEQVYNNLKR